MKIGQKLIIVFLAVTIIPILLIGLLGFSNAKSSLEDLTIEGLNVTAEFKEEITFLYLDTLKKRTADFASDGFIRDRLLIANDGTADLGGIYKEVTDHLVIEKQSLDEAILFIDILDIEGRVIFSSIPDRVGNDKSQENSFIKGKEGRQYVKDVHRESDGTLDIEVSAPIKAHIHHLEHSGAHEREIIGVLVNHFDASIVNDLMISILALELGAKTQMRGLGETGEIYIVNEDKLMISDSLFIEDAIFKQKVNTYPVRKCLEENEEVVGIWPDYRGVSVAGASMCLDFGDFKWILLSEQDEDEAFAPIATLQKSSVVVATITIFIVMLMALGFTRSLTSPIEKLINGVKKIGKGNLDYKIQIESKDEIGQLAAAFNQMTDDLKGHGREMERKNTELEKGKVELENINEKMVGRELKMLELKKEILDLKKQLKDNQ